MSIYLQIAIGLAPVLLVFVILSIVQKKGRLVNLISGATFLATVVTMVALHAGTPQTVGISEEETDAQLGMVYAAAHEKDGRKLAYELLHTLRQDSGDQGELTLCDALLHAVEGNATAAKALYMKAQSMLDLEDDTFLSLCNKVFDENGFLNGEALEKLKSYAAKQIKERIPSDVYSDTAEAVIAAENVFSQYIVSDTFDEEEVRKNLRKLDGKLEDYPEIFRITHVRLTRMKLNILLGNFKNTAQNLTEDASYDELAIVSELYLAGMIKESSFTEEFGAEFKVQAQAVAEQLEKAAESIEKATVRRNAKEMVKRLEKAAKFPAVYRMMDSISKIAADINNADRSKAYLQLAKFEYDAGNTQTAEGHITSALETVGMSDDDSYFVPMSNLVEIVTDNDDPEKLKEIATYVDQVTTHSSDEMVIKAVEQKQQEQEQNPEQGDPSTEEGSEKTDFGGHMTDTLNQTRIMLDITHVDSTKFDTVTATINISDALAQNADELKTMLNVTDCGVTIEDFTVEKVEFTDVNILLCCDISGSMDGQPIQDLKNAVIKFLETSPEQENVALVTFSSGVNTVLGFQSDPEQLMQAAQGIYSGGGTNMYDALIRSISEFTNDPNSINYILLLSDGQDGNYHGIEDMQIDIGNPAQNAGIVLYSLGLGYSVDSAYMSNLASVTGGDFMHVSDSETLVTFYEKLRNQAMNRYKITFKAEDTMSVSRNVKVALKDKPTIVNDTYFYSIGSEGENEEQKEYENVSMSGKTITSLSTNLIYKSALTTAIQAFGEGFTAEDTYSVKLDGALDYDSVPCAFVNATTLDITIPGGIACGEYDVRISINGKTAILKNALSVVTQGGEKTTTFGPYVFTSYSKTQNGDVITLDSHVNMNGWLYFNGDVTLTGDLTAQFIYLTDYEGGYVRFNASTAQGYAATLANRGEALHMGALGTVQLYNEPDVSSTSDDYPTDKVPIPELILPNLLWSKMPSMQLYPHKLVIDLTGFNTDLPLQDKLVKDTKKELFEFDANAEMTVSNTRIDLKVEGEMGTNPDKGKVMATVGKMSIPVYKGNIKLELDTSKGLFGIDMGVEIPALFKGNDTGLGLKLEWESRAGSEGMQKLCPSMVQFKVDYPVKTSIGGVPITLDDFKLALEGIDPNKSILDCHFKGSMDIGLSKASDYLPGLDKKIGDVSLLKMDDTTIELAWNDQYIGLKTTLKFLNEITLGEYSIEAGRLPFTVVLLDMYDVEAYGMRASSKEGIIWDTDNCDVDISGTGKLSVNPNLFAVEYTGKAEIDLQWWVFNKRFKESGTAMVAFYTDEKGLFNFAVIAQGSDFWGTKQYYLMWNKDTDLKVGSKRV